VSVCSGKLLNQLFEMFFMQSLKNITFVAGSRFVIMCYCFCYMFGFFGVLSEPALPLCVVALYSAVLKNVHEHTDL